MATKIKTLGLAKLAKAEHLNFHLEAVAFIEKCGAENISIETELSLYRTAIDAEIKVVNLQSASALTPEMEAKDKERDEYLSFLFATIDAAKNSPIEAQREAHRQLTPVVSPYQGIARSTDSQESSQIVGLVNDILSSPALVPHTAALNIDPVVSALNSANNDYIKLDAKRTSEIPSKAETNKKRAAVDEQYFAIVDKANATVILAPNDSALTLVNDLNNLIDKTNADYNRRTAKRGGDEPKE